MNKNSENFYIKMNKILFAIIISIFSTIPFILKFEPPKGVYFESNNQLYRAIQCIYLSFEEFDLKWSLFFIFIYYFVNNTFKEKISKKKAIAGIILSLLLTTITIIGKSLKADNTLKMLVFPNYQIFKTTILGIGYFFIYYILYRKIINLNIIINKKKDKNKLLTFFDKHQTIISILLIIITWIPIAIIYYPGVASGDTLDSLAQFFNQRDNCWSAKAIILKNNDVILNKHHSVLFTMLLGLTVKIGNNMISYNFGMFLFILLVCKILERFDLYISCFSRIFFSLFISFLL